jgi:serine/threonine protein phosphatase PrpC
MGNFLYIIVEIRVLFLVARIQTGQWLLLLSAEPDISERIIDEFDDFFILATDGVWDVVDNNYAVQIIHSFIAKS